MAPSPDDIAIIGISCRFPGADSPSKLWENLINSKDVQSEITRFNSKGFYKPDGGPRKGLTNVRHAYFIEEGVDRFDNAFFNISPLESEAMDPQQRILLEIAYETVENAGIRLEDFQGSDTAVFTASIVNDYHASLLRDIDQTPKYQATGTSNAILANRISYVFDLHGASISIDTACSGTIVGLHQAIMALNAGESRMALVCGANLIISPDMFVHMSELGFLSPSGRCRSFDASGDGYARGEGVAGILLKRLADAQRDGDPIRAVIKATRLNQDGRTQGMTMPSGDAQRRNLDALYSRANLDPGSIQYVEAHGTGTAVGDPIEIGAIDAVFGKSHAETKLIVGSIKSNIGHLESTAALAGIIKTVLAIEKGQIPPQMHFKKPNPKINWDRILVPTEKMPWPVSAAGVRRAGVNSFGFGGTNGHAVLEYDPSLQRESPAYTDRPYLLKVSAANAASLQQTAATLSTYIKTVKPNLGDLSHTLLARRSTLRLSCYVVASSHEELIEKLSSAYLKPMTRSNNSVENIAFVFTGQGAQWPEMGKQLLQCSPLFKNVIERCDEILASLPDGPSWSIKEELQKPKETSRLPKASFSQPICSALQIGLIELWKSWGITPQAVVGHSSGEIGAAYAAGLLSLRDAIIIAYYRGLYLGENAPIKLQGQKKGAMCAIGLGQNECHNLLQKYSGRIALAAVNSPSSCTLSGDEDAIREVVESCGKDGTFCRALRVDMAYHSHHMLPLAPSYEKAMRAAGVCSSEGSSQTCEMFSSVTGHRLSKAEVTPSYWKQNMVSTVHFSAAVSELVQQCRPDAVIELGPHPALSGPARDTMANVGLSEIPYFSSCYRGKPDLAALLESVGEMIPTKVPIDWKAVNALEIVENTHCKHQVGRVLTDVPKYQWDHSLVHWGESRLSLNVRTREFPRHELLGARIPTDISLAPTWRNVLTSSEVGWLSEGVGNTPRTLSIAIFALMALEAARQVKITNRVELPVVSLKDVHLSKALELEYDRIETLFSLHQTDKDSQWRFEIFCAGAGRADNTAWSKCCTGTLSFAAYMSQRESTRLQVRNDEELLRYIQSFETVNTPPVEHFHISAQGACGKFSKEIKGYECYPVHPILLAQLLNVPEMLMLSSNLPASYSVQSVGLIELPLGQGQLEIGSFETSLLNRTANAGYAGLKLFSQDTTFMTMDRIKLKMENLVKMQPPLQSKFFKPTILPDITYMSRSAQMPVERLIELVTHKWPMCDFGLIDLADGDICTITSSIKGLKPGERPSFRSVDVIGGQAPVLGSPLVRNLKETESSRKFHLFVGPVKSIRPKLPPVHQNGFVCLRWEDEDDEAYLRANFMELCPIAGFKSDNWVLARPQPPQNGVIQPNKIWLFATSPVPPVISKEYSNFELVRLDDTQSLDTWKEHVESSSTTDQFDVIVLDSGEKSLLTQWPGARLLSWIRPLLKRVGSLLWVSEKHNFNPFQGVAASFIKTLKAEQPMLKAASVVFQDCDDQDFLAETIFDIFDRLIHNDAEHELIVKEKVVHCVRYRPDDTLNATVGLLPPISSSLSLQSRSYSLMVTGSHKVTMITEKKGVDGNISDGAVQIRIGLSVIDDADLAQFTTGHTTIEDYSLGHYFYGSIISSRDAKFPVGSKVLGWCSHAHKDTTEVTPNFVHIVPDSVPAVDAVAKYAAITTATLLVHGAARALPDDTFDIKVTGILGEALRIVCDKSKITVLSGDQAKDADFTIELSLKNGLILNGRQANVMKFIHNPKLRELAIEMFSEWTKSTDNISVFKLRDHQKAFHEAIERGPFTSVITHEKLDEIEDALVCSTRSTVFRSDGFYILVGGLGGLGQHIALWMAEHGVRHIVTISRSGTESDSAQMTVQALKQIGVEVKALKIDATDIAAVKEALSQIRKVLPIRGCINLAMILADAPISTMSPEQWDRAVQVKILSTWNLHLATLEDKLDFFIMFSSISSIFGNRTQANYATGNAFLNEMTGYRHSLGLPASTIALSPVTGIGVLANNEELLRTFRVSGLEASDGDDINKIITAAILESSSPESSVITVGFQMFETVDGQIQASPDQTQIYWKEYPEFSSVMVHKMSDAGSSEKISLREKLLQNPGAEGENLLLREFTACLQNIMGQDQQSFDPNLPLSQYGVDSLNAVAVRYWFFKELDLDVAVFDILGSKSIRQLIARVYQKLGNESSKNQASALLPQPKHLENLKIRPLSNSQKRIWFLQKFLPDKTVYNLLLVCHINGSVEPEFLARTWTVFMQRHEVLRSSIVDTPDGLQQIPNEDFQFPLTVVNCANNEFSENVKQLTSKAKGHIFNIEKGEVIRGWLLRSPEHARFFLASHHIAWDRSSVPVIFSETTAIYKSLLNGHDPQATLQPPPYQFIDYTIWQEQFLSEKALVQPLVDFWKNTLDGAPEVVGLLPISKTDKRPTMKQYSTGTLSRTLTGSLSTNIKEFCKRKAVTPFMFIAAALSSLISRLNGEQDIVIGIPDGDRGHSAFDNIVGFAVNMLPIRTKIQSDASYENILENYRDTCLRAYEHRAMPFDHLVQILEVPRRTSHTPVFQITVNYQIQGSFPEADYGSFRFTDYDHYNAKTQSDLSLEVEELSSGKLLCRWEFDEDLYDVAGISDLADMYQIFIEDIIEKGGQTKLEDVRITSDSDLAQINSLLQPRYESEPFLVELNKSLFLERFRLAVSRYPDKLALADEQAALTYQDLELQTNAIANRLISSGAKVGDVIAICCEQNRELLIGIYGILKAGCGYVPIDPDFPVERIQSMIDDASVQRALVENTADAKSQRILACGISISNIFEINGTRTAIDADTSSPKLDRAITHLDPLCCIFTSGSTGRPKGVSLSHGQLRYQMEGYTKFIGVNSESKLLLSSAVVFDLHLVAVYATILHGASVFVASREARYSPTKMVDTLVNQHISSCIFTPTQAKMIFNASNKEKLLQWIDIDSFVLGGETIPPWFVREFYKLLPHAKLYNGYAPAETTVINSLRLITPEDSQRPSVPVQGPIFPSRFYILDSKMHPVPIGVPGELYIAGPNVSHSYLNRPEITAKVFSKDHQAPEMEKTLGYGNIYRTGDRLRLNRDGTVDFLGRIGSDRQVKIRGMRTELEEIENSIYDAYESVKIDEDIPKLGLVATVYHRIGDYDGVLAAYLTTADDNVVPEEEKEKFIRYLRLSLKSVLPPHMLPAAYLFVKDLPRTASGKVDYKAIVAWPVPSIATTNTVRSTQGKELTETQSLIAAIWKELLSISGELNASDEFFTLGGHSLLMVPLQQKIRDAFGVTLNLADMFAYPSISGFEELVLSNSEYRYGHGQASTSMSKNAIDWAKEISLPEDSVWSITDYQFKPPSVLVVTGASGMIGAHFVHYVLTNTNNIVHCIALPNGQNGRDPKQEVLNAFVKWNLDTKAEHYERIVAYHGSLSDPLFGLSPAQWDFLDKEADAIYHLDSEVSLLKNYEDLRAGNVGAVERLIDLARGKSSGRIKPLNHLSTWGVAHLQTWATTTLKTDKYLTGEQEMDHMTPGPESSLGYLKCRWVCESLLYEAARRGLPVRIYRSCMVATNPSSQRGLDRTDINRRILESMLETGLVPDFNSKIGGGMSWIDLNFLIESIHFLSRRPTNNDARRAEIFNMVPEKHIQYNEFTALLGNSYEGNKLRLVEPREWAVELCKTGNPEMVMHAEVLESWYNAHWAPIALEADKTVQLLREEAGLVPPKVDRQFILERIIGQPGF